VKQRPKRGILEAHSCVNEFIKFSREDHPPDRQGVILNSSLPDFGVVVAGE